MLPGQMTKRNSHSRVSAHQIHREGQFGGSRCVRPVLRHGWIRRLAIRYQRAVHAVQYLIQDVSIDDLKFGVKAIGVDGSESLVSAYLHPPRAKIEIETIQ